MENISIITTKRKKRIIDDLTDYWELKGLLLRCKKHPILLLESQNLDVIIKYLETHTYLPMQNFWIKFSRLHKYAICRHFTLLEANLKQKIQISRENPELFVIILGVAHVSYSNENGDILETEFKQGSVFGALSVFNYESNDKFNSESLDDIYSGNLYFPCSVTIEKCCLLKLAFLHFSKGIRDLEEEQGSIMTAHSTSNIDDRSLIDSSISSKAKSILNETLFHFLMHNSILSVVNLDKYIHEGSTGEILKLNKSVNDTVFILIDGSFRIEMCKRGHKEFFENSRFPVMKFEPGSVLNISENCFEHLITGSLPPIPGIRKSPKKHRKLHLSKKELLKLNADFHFEMPPTLEILYDLEIVFDAVTTYLALPLELFKDGMKDTSVMINKEIIKQLTQLGETLETRLRFLLPTLDGKNTSIQIPDNTLDGGNFDKSSFTLPLISSNSANSKVN